MPEIITTRLSGDDDIFTALAPVREQYLIHLIVISVFGSIAGRVLIVLDDLFEPDFALDFVGLTQQSILGLDTALEGNVLVVPFDPPIKAKRISAIMDGAGEALVTINTSLVSMSSLDRLWYFIRHGRT